MDQKRLVSDLVGAMFPSGTLIGKRLRRDWIARALDPLPAQEVLTKIQMLIEQAVASSIEQAYSAGCTEAQLEQIRPSILLIKLHDFHLLVRIESAGPEATVGDDIAIAQWGTLQALDMKIRLQDLQGLPSEFWFFLRAVRSAQEDSGR
jgi:hypothetical protein